MQVMTVADVAATVRRSRQTVRRWHSEGLLPKADKPSGQLLWPADRIQFWIKSGMPRREEFEALEATRDRFAKA